MPISNPATGGSSASTTMVDWREKFTELNTDDWDVTVTGDAVAGLGGTTAGSSYVRMAISPFGGEDNSVVIQAKPTGKYKIPAGRAYRYAPAVTYRNRTVWRTAHVGLVGLDASGAVEPGPVVPADVLSFTGGVTVASSIGTITTTTPHGLLPGDWVEVYGMAGNGYQQTGLYQVILIPTLSSFTFTPKVTTAGSYGSTGSVRKYDITRGFANSWMLNLWDGSAGAALVTSRCDSGSPWVSAWNPGSSWETGANPSSNGVTYNISYSDASQPLRFPEFYDLDDNAGINMKVIDSLSTTQSTWSLDRSIPRPAGGWVPRFELSANKCAGRMIRILSSTKSGSATGTHVTVEPHGLATGDYIQLFGVADQTVFPNMNAPGVVTVIDATSFTLVNGTSATGTTYGGLAIVANAGAASTLANLTSNAGFITASDRGVSYGYAAGTMLVTSTTTITAPTIGSAVYLAGQWDRSLGLGGGDRSYLDGLWKVVSVPSTTTLLLEPLQGQQVLMATGSAGFIFTAPEMLVHYVRAETVDRQRVVVEGAVNHSRLSSAVPVAVKEAPTITTTYSGTQTVLATTTPTTPSQNYTTTTATAYTTILRANTATAYGFVLSNPTATPAYVKIYNKVTAPTLGTDVPFMIVPVPAQSCVVHEYGPVGLRFSAGISIGVTGGPLNSDTTATVAGIIVTVSYI